jgi:hypothetical protein
MWIFRLDLFLNVLPHFSQATLAEAAAAAVVAEAEEAMVVSLLMLPSDSTCTSRW